MKTACDLTLRACCWVAALLRLLIAIQAGILLTQVMETQPAVQRHPALTDH